MDIWDWFARTFNISLFKEEMDTIIDMVKKETDPDSCPNCEKRRGIRKCPWERDSQFCNVIRNNKALQDEQRN